MNGRHFAQTRIHEIDSLIARYPLAKTVIVHEAGSSGLGHVYFPIIYTYGEAAHQYTAESYQGDSNDLVALPSRESQIRLPNITSQYIIVLHSVKQSAEDIAKQVQKGDTPLEDGPVVRALSESQRWTRVRDELLVSFCKTHVTVFASCSGANSSDAQAP